MGRKLVAGNWKMHKTPTEAAALVESFIKLVDLQNKAEVVLCPPYLAIPRVHDLLKGTKVALGAQDAFWEQQGAFTGKISPSMLSDAGVSYCIVGHSETRGRFGKSSLPQSTLGYFAEADETVNLKIKALLFCDIKPILCVGETIEERDAGQTDKVVALQLERGLEGLAPEELDGHLVVAYEPVWAIGTGRTCEAGEAQRVCALIRSLLPGAIGERCRVIYGGSVKASNSRELFSQADIDGGLVGGASLDAREFAHIVLSA